MIPFYVDGEAVGTIWVVSHDARHQFDAEDLRVVSNLATFASAAYRTVRTNAAMDQAKHALGQTALEMQRFSFLVESSDDAIVSKNLDGIIQSWNKGAERVFGYTAEEAIGKPITFLMMPDRYEEEAKILECLRRGERITPFETIRRRKDGSLIHVGVTMSPVRDADGHIIGASKIARDITARQQAQEAQSLLLGEMRHRINNLFAITNALGDAECTRSEGADGDGCCSSTTIGRSIARSTTHPTWADRPRNEIERRDDAKGSYPYNLRSIRVGRF